MIEWIGRVYIGTMRSISLLGVSSMRLVDSSKG